MYIKVQNKENVDVTYYHDDRIVSLETDGITIALNANREGLIDLISKLRGELVKYHMSKVKLMDWNIEHCKSRGSDASYYEERKKIYLEEIEHAKKI